jgi:hypothetical protein
MPGFTAGGVVARTALAWLLAQRTGLDGQDGAAKRPGISKRDELVAAKLEHERAKLEREQMRVRKLRGELISVDEHLAQRRALVEMVVGHLVRWPAEASVRCGQPKLKPVLEQCVEELRRAMASDDKRKRKGTA